MAHPSWPPGRAGAAHARPQPPCRVTAAPARHGTSAASQRRAPCGHPARQLWSQLGRALRASRPQPAMRAWQALTQSALPTAPAALQRPTRLRALTGTTSTGARARDPPARGSSPPPALPRASGPRAACAASPPPHQASAWGSTQWGNQCSRLASASLADSFGPLTGKQICLTDTPATRQLGPGAGRKHPHKGMTARHARRARPRRRASRRP